MRPPPAIETTRRHPTPVRLSSQPFVSKLASHVACVCSSILCSHCSASTSVFVPSAKVLGKADDPHHRESVKELIKSPSSVSLDRLFARTAARMLRFARRARSWCNAEASCRLLRLLQIATIQPKRTWFLDQALERVGAHGSAAIFHRRRHRRGRLSWPLRLVRAVDDRRSSRQGLLHERRRLGHAGRVNVRSSVYLVYGRQGVCKRADDPAGGGEESGRDAAVDRICWRQRRGCYCRHGQALRRRRARPADKCP